jgi:putative acetyltransferase
MTISDEVVVAAARPDTPEIQALLAERDAHFDRLYADEDRKPGKIDLGRQDLIFFTARVRGQLAGCGALIVHAAYGELKRFYLRPEFRGLGLGRRLVETLETQARAHGCRALKLETGILQPEAINLYRSAGFTDGDCFGEQRPDPLSIYLHKDL